ncbi:hypothetical protein A9986_05725 [Solibacillus silvestris]|nr:oligosaccharide flippase family protein [Solibacillus silvestris]OBW58434.1 hypothetical protein A9986_05725 [Solibacillus silvestris]
MWNKFKKIQKKISWSLFGNIIYALSQWGIITILARFGTVEELGIYSLGLAITAPIVIFFSFELRTLLATESKNEMNFGQYFGSRVVHLIISYFTIVLIAIIYSNDSKVIAAILLIGMIKVFEALSDICMGLFQKKQRIDIIGKSQLYKGLLSIITFSAIYIPTQSLVISLIGLLLVMIIRLFTFDLKNLKKYVETFLIFDNSSIKLMKYALPLGIASLISSLITNVPKYLLEYQVGIEAVGIFSALYYILVACNMLITPISLLAAPRIANTLDNKDNVNFIKENIIFSLFSVIAFLIIFIPVYLYSEWVITFLYGEEYILYSQVFVIITLSLLFGFLNAFYSLSTIAARIIKIQPIFKFFLSLIIIISSYYFINEFGIMGAAYALILTRSIETLFYIILLVYIANKKFHK